MTPSISFRRFAEADRDACLMIFDANCPEFFAPNERGDYKLFLDAVPNGYEVCELAGRTIAAFGLVSDDVGVARLIWIMLDPGSQGSGVGSIIMKRVISRSKAMQSDMLKIAASHKSAPFFAKFGAMSTLVTADGWGPGMDRVDMALVL